MAHDRFADHGRHTPRGCTRLADALLGVPQLEIPAAGHTGMVRRVREAGKAAIVQAVRPSPRHRTELQTYRNITRSIFTHRTPKEIFIGYYNEIKQMDSSHL